MICLKVLKVLFSKKFYIPSALVVGVIIFSLLAYLEEFLFFNPYAFYIPKGELFVFSLITSIAILSGLTVPLAIYKIFKYKFTIGSTKEFLAVFLGLSAGCGCSFAISLIAVAGALGSSILGFITLYQNPIRILSIALLSYSFYIELNFLSSIYCKK